MNARAVATRLLCALCSWAATAAALAVAQQSPDPDPAREFFAKGGVVKVELTLAPAERQQLREQPRSYVPATLRLDGGAPWSDVGIKLKGAAGSFQKIDERPGFTVHLGKFGGESRLHGLRRFHLNNGAQDDSRLCEWLGHEVFEAAGRPAPRVGHAHVFLDGNELGLYVLREAFDAQFLRRAFGTTAGNLYDGGFCQDIDQDLEKDSGDGAGDHGDLHALLAACRAEGEQRWQQFAQLVDVDALIDFCALEAMLGHWDGYAANRNNFRLWVPQQGGALFLPHGMDQLFGDADASILKHPGAIVAQALMENPKWRKRYRDRLRQLLPQLSPQRLGPRLQAVSARISKALERTAPALAKDHERAARELDGRMQARYRDLRNQVRAPEPKPLAIAIGRSVTLREWRPAAQTDHVELGKKGFGGVSTLMVACRDGGDGLRVGVWRTSLLLERGRYRLLAKVRCDGVVAPEGVGMFLVALDARSAVLTGDNNWQALQCEFTVDAFQRETELSLELHATAGKGWFRFDSLQLERLP